MIPKKAWFYWSGPRMSWLRQQSLETFQRLNPSWECKFIHVKKEPAEGLLRDRVVQSDLARYQTLHSEGGMYFDTDIIFLKPIPDLWIYRDVCMVSKDGAAQGVAVLGGREGSLFFLSLVTHCKERLNSKVMMAYQSLGIKLFIGKDTRKMASDFGESLYEIPIELLFPRPWGAVEDLWSDIQIPLHPEAVGIHWFGGDELSREMEPKIMPGTLDEYPCLLTRVLK